MDSIFKRCKFIKIISNVNLNKKLNRIVDLLENSPATFRASLNVFIYYHNEIRTDRVKEDQTNVSKNHLGLRVNFVCVLVEIKRFRNHDQLLI